MKRGGWKLSSFKPVHAMGTIILRDLTVRYGRHVVLDSVSGTFISGSMTAVVGANGAGKSTLLEAIAGMARPTAGTVSRPTSGQLAFLSQVSAINRDYPLTVAELIQLGGWREFGAFRQPSLASRERVEAAASKVELSERLGHRIDRLSVGELRRAQFARLMLDDAAAILLDEPFAAVDARTTSLLLDQISRWNEEGRTVIAVLHDLDLVREWFPSTLVLARRCISWGPTETALRAMAT
jgi:zinc/manganese transport system ATP-binding protein